MVQQNAEQFHLFPQKLQKKTYYHFHIPKWPYHKSFLLAVVLCWD
jgi:hypothetical protein